MTKKDIDSRTDIELLVHSFYIKVQQNETIGHLFIDVAHVNWETHLPTMYNFWEMILLGVPSFHGNPMTKHVALNKQTPITAIHFDAWLSMWCSTVDELFEGPKADEAKNRAKSIAGTMLFNIQRNS